MKTTLIIMAAGIGSRFGTGIKQLAKMSPNGEIIMDYSIYDAKEAGFDKVVFIIRKDIEERDSRDMNREISPLRQAEDAVLVDSSEMTIEEVVKRILQIFHEKVILSDEVGKNES